MTGIRISAYRIMWLQVCFDLPVKTAAQRRIAANFRKALLGDGFKMFQYSVYWRHCASSENARVHKQRVRSWLPEEGNVSILEITDKQFGRIERYDNQAPGELPEPSHQLELF